MLNCWYQLFFPLHHYMNYLQFLFYQYTFSVINFNLSVNLSTFKIVNPHTWKGLSFRNFSFFFFFFSWVKSFSLVFILLFNDTLMKSTCKNPCWVRVVFAGWVKLWHPYELPCKIERMSTCNFIFEN